MPNVAGVDRSSFLSNSLSSAGDSLLWYLTNTTQEANAASARAEDTPAIAVELIPPFTSLSDNGTLASPKLGEIDLEMMDGSGERVGREDGEDGSSGGGQTR